MRRSPKRMLGLPVIILLLCVPARSRTTPTWTRLFEREMRVVKPEVVKKAIDSIKRVAGYEYFFSKLKSPDWIIPLWQEGMFRDPNRPVVEGKYISFPFWPESQYLVRMARLDSLEVKRTVYQVALQIPETDNV